MGLLSTFARTKGVHDAEIEFAWLTPRIERHAAKFAVPNLSPLRDLTWNPSYRDGATVIEQLICNVIQAKS